MRVVKITLYACGQLRSIQALPYWIISLVNTVENSVDGVQIRESDMLPKSARAVPEWSRKILAFRQALKAHPGANWANA
jgi:hypothetical protein